jgi:hypothetical protein
MKGMVGRRARDAGSANVTMDNPKNPSHGSRKSFRAIVLRYGCAVVSIALAT